MVLSIPGGWRSTGQGAGDRVWGLASLGFPELGGVYLVVASVQACRPKASGSYCMRIHVGTLGTFPREVGRSLGGFDQVFLPGKKKEVSSKAVVEATPFHGGHTLQDRLCSL